MKKIIVVLMMLSGCASVPNAVTQVKVPVSVPCVIQKIDKPAFAVDGLSIEPPAGVTREEFIWQQMNALRADRLQRKGYESELEAAIRSCQ